MSYTETSPTPQSIYGIEHMRVGDPQASPPTFLAVVRAGILAAPNANRWVPSHVTTDQVRAGLRVQKSQDFMAYVRPVPHKTWRGYEHSEVSPMSAPVIDGAHELLLPPGAPIIVSDETLTAKEEHDLDYARRRLSSTLIESRPGEAVVVIGQTAARQLVQRLYKNEEMGDNPVLRIGLAPMLHVAINAVEGWIEASRLVGITNQNRID